MPILWRIYVYRNGYWTAAAHYRTEGAARRCGKYHYSGMGLPWTITTEEAH